MLSMLLRNTSSSLPPRPVPFGQIMMTLNSTSARSFAPSSIGNYGISHSINRGAWSAVNASIIIPAGTTELSIKATTGAWRTASITLGLFKDYLISIDDWADDNFARIQLYNCDRLVSVPSYLPTSITDCVNMFGDCLIFNQDLSTWDMSRVTTIAQMFNRTGAFNGNLKGWDLRSVETMSTMFAEAKAFNNDISDWKISNKLTSMASMFSQATAFNQPINWSPNRTVGVNISGMFASATNFNQDLSSWRGTVFTNSTGYDTGATAWQSSYKPL